MAHNAAANLGTETAPSQLQEYPAKRGNSSHSSARRLTGEPREGWGGDNSLLGKGSPGQGSPLCLGLGVMLCSPGKAETENSPLPPGRSVLSHSALFFSTTFFSPLPLKFPSLHQQFQCHLFKCHLWSPPSPRLPFPRSFLHISYKNQPNQHPHRILPSSCGALHLPWLGRAEGRPPRDPGQGKGVWRAGATVPVLGARALVRLLETRSSAREKPSGLGCQSE